jgi:hypothetical protein
MPMDAGTINLLNRVALKGPALPKNLAMIHKDGEVEDINLEGVEGSIENKNTKIILDLGAPMPDPADIAEEQLQADYYDPIEPDEKFLVSPDPLQQLEPELSGAEHDRGEENSVAETRRERMSAATPAQENGGKPPTPPSGIARSKKPLATSRGATGPHSRWTPEHPRREPDRYKPATSIIKEPQTLHEKGVFKAVDPRSLSELQRSSLIRSSELIGAKHVSRYRLNIREFYQPTELL